MSAQRNVNLFRNQISDLVQMENIEERDFKYLFELLKEIKDVYLPNINEILDGYLYPVEGITVGQDKYKPTLSGLVLSCIASVDHLKEVVVKTRDDLKKYASDIAQEHKRNWLPEPKTDKVHVISIDKDDQFRVILRGPFESQTAAIHWGRTYSHREKWVSRWEHLKLDLNNTHRVIIVNPGTHAGHYIKTRYSILPHPVVTPNNIDQMHDQIVLIGPFATIEAFEVFEQQEKNQRTLMHLDTDGWQVIYLEDPFQPLVIQAPTPLQ